MKNQKGITLIALIITILVLLILAGVAISMVIGNNGVVNKAQNAKSTHSLAELEELANIEYTSLKINDYVIGLNEVDGQTVLDANKVTVKDVANNLKTKYEIKEVSSSGSGTVTGISVNSNNVSMGKNGTLDIEVTLNGGESSSAGKDYYALVDGVYHKITISNGKVVIEKAGKTEAEIENSSGGGESTLTAESNNSNITVAVGANNKVTITSGSSTVNGAQVTISYGEYSEVVTVSVIAMPTESSTPNSSTSFATNYGTIDVIWLDTENNVKSVPNAPDLYNNSLEKVTWTKSGDTWTEDTTAQSTWYSYNAVTSRNASTSHTDDNLTSMWANAKNPVDGSYFVWIPRYAYRITYYSSETSTTPTGYYDGWGMWKAEDGSVKYALDSGVETVTYNGNKYIVHPAFETNLNNGGWSTDLSGIWVSKYEMSQEKSTDSGTTWNTVNTSSNSIGNILTKNAGNSNYIRAVSKPSTSTTTVSSWRYITIGNMYTNAYGYDRDKESHLMKNSEWGAVAYLTHSQYGRNGNEIDINNSTTYLTGNGGGAVGGTASTASGITNYYNTTNGAKASTTGNVYGIYDISGGACEYTASWDSAAADLNNYISSYGSSFASKGGASTKYATAYSNGTSTYNGTKIYEVGKIGDGIKETLNGGNSISGWFSDYANFAFSSYPFFIRGGSYNGGANAGAFCSYYADGHCYRAYSFRAVLSR